MSKKIVLNIVIISALLGTGFVVAGYMEKYDKSGLADLSAPESNIYEATENEVPDSESGENSLPVAPSKNNDTTTPSSKKESTTMNKQHLVTIKTDFGDIKFITHDADAPNTVNNFITLAGKGFYDKVLFHRVIDGFMIQGGDPTGTGMGGPGYAFEDELNPSTDSYKEGYKKGVVAMANSGPNTNGSQFFIMVADVPLPKNYTIFGKVVSGQEVADRISQTPRDTRNNDRPIEPVWMNKVTVEKNISY